MSPNRTINAFLCCLLGVCGGCSPWSASSTPNSLLKPPPLPPDSVVLEVAVLEVPEDEAADCEQLWREADEQQLPIEQRRKLASCGLRCGVIGNQLPDWIRERLDASRRTVDLDEETGMAQMSDTKAQRRVHCRPGQDSSIPIGGLRETLTVDLGSQGEEPISYEEAECQFALKTVPKGDGRVGIQLSPEIYHGPKHQCWVAEEGSFRLDSARDCARFDDLQVECTVSPGQTLVLTSSPDRTGLGATFFGDAKSKNCRTVLLVRLAQTQLDDLFAPDQSLTPIASPAQ